MLVAEITLGRHCSAFVLCYQLTYCSQESPVIAMVALMLQSRQLTILVVCLSVGSVSNLGLVTSLWSDTHNMHDAVTAAWACSSMLSEYREGEARSLADCITAVGVVDVQNCSSTAVEMHWRCVSLHHCSDIHALAARYDE